jgi:hypothetical protein
MSVNFRTREGTLEVYNAFKGLVPAQWPADGTMGGLAFKETHLTAAQVKAMNATPKEVAPAPASGYANIFEAALLYHGTGTAYTVGGTSDFAFRYTDGSGTILGECETTGFMDQATAQFRMVRAYRAASGVSDITPTAAAALVLHTLNAELTTGTADLLVRVYYHIVPVVLTF